MKNKFKIGDKVKIINKSYYKDLENSCIYNNGKKRGVWYIIDIEYIDGKMEIIYIVSENRNVDSGDYFLECDLIPFVKVELLEDKLFDI